MRKKTRAVVVSSSILVTLGAIGLSVLLFVYVTFLQQLQITLATSDIKSKTEQLNSVADLDKYLTVQNQLAALPGLHDSKGIYSRMLSFLPVLNPNAPNSVVLSKLQLNTVDKFVTVTGTTKSFESLNIFVDTMQNAQATYKDASGAQQTTNIFTNALVQSSSIDKTDGGNRVSFVINAEYQDVVFDATNSDVTASIPNIQTSQSVTESPKLFNSSENGQ